MEHEDQFPPHLDLIHEVIAVLSEPDQDEGHLAGIVTSAICAYARRIGKSPQAVADDVFTRLPGAEEWERTGLPELEAWAAEIIERHTRRDEPEAEG